MKTKRNIIIYLCLISLFLSVIMSDVKIQYGYCDSCSEIVIAVDTQRVLWENNADAKKAMASTTKVLTAITIIENYDITQKITIKKEWCNIEGSSVYLKEGE